MKDAAPVTIQLKDYTPPTYLIQQTKLRIELEEDETLVSSELSFIRNPDASMTQKTLVLDGHGLNLLSLSLNEIELSESSQPADDSLSYEIVEDGLKIHNPPSEFVLKAKVSIHPESNKSLEGLYKSKTMFCTQCEAEGFRKITYYLDRPDVMSEFTTTIVANKSLYPILLSNGNPIDKGDEANGKHWQTWHDPHKKPCYLFAMVAGNLQVIEDSFVTQSNRKVSIQVFVEEKDLDKCDHAIASLKNAMRWDEETYGREYDLDIFMIVAVDDFNMGAMENKGLNIFNTSCVLASPEITTDAGFQRVESVVAHEYFHNWSGNRVTCRDWFQLSLKEGFTVFRDEEFSADMGSRTVTRVQDVTQLRTLQFAEDAGPMAHPVQPPSYIEISNFYTLTIYEKGAEVVRMIHNLLGAEDFRKGSDIYFSRYDGQAVTIDEFTSAMEAASGKDLTQFKRWYTQAGTPKLTISDEYNKDKQEYRLTIKQSCPPTPESKTKLPFHMPLAMGLIGERGELTFSFVSDESGEEKSTEVTKHCVLDIKEEQQTFILNNVSERPVPSLLRNFSAPVRLEFDYSREDLKRLISFDSDGFCRWDAAQQLAIQIMKDLMSSFSGLESDAIASRKVIGSEIDSSLADAYSIVVEEKDLDPAMLALMLQLPSEAYLSEISTLVDVDGIHQAREALRLSIASNLREQLLATYQNMQCADTYEASALQIAQRSLKNVSMAYLSLVDGELGLDRCYQQYNAADNMTDRLAALTCIVNSTVEGSDDLSAQCLDHFYQKYQNEALAVDLWFSVQAASIKSNTLENVKKLLEHPGFSITNPNKVRSLVGVFCNQNLVNFHNANGEGYRFLSLMIEKLNAFNPQVASRLVTPLTRWRKYDSQRQALMTAELKKLAGLKDLSKDVFEIVTKSLND
ncbi:aminopeptidase N [Aurantivibrio infirmus]